MSSREKRESRIKGKTCWDWWLITQKTTEQVGSKQQTLKPGWCGGKQGHCYNRDSPRESRKEHPERKSWALEKSSRTNTPLRCPWDTESWSRGDGAQQAGQGLKVEISEHWLACVGFPGGAGGKEPICQCRRCKTHRFDPWVEKIP